MPITLDGTNGITLPNGSNTVPASKGSTGGNTAGIVYPAANTIAFATSGTEVARFDSAGNLGVGTSSPATRLHVNGNITLPSYGQIVSQDTTTGISISGSSAGYPNGGTIVFRGNTAAGGVATNGLEFISGGSERMRIDSTGRVTKPYQPYLRAVTSTSAQSLTGGTTYVIPFNVISYQTGSNYNNSTYRFTCPVAGQYFVSASVEGSNITSNYYNLFLRINGSGFAGTYVTGRGVAYEQLSTTGIVAASAGDYIDVALYVNQTGGSLELNPGDIRNSLHIYLLG
jgi:hypothetical protein